MLPSSFHVLPSAIDCTTVGELHVLVYNRDDADYLVPDDANIACLQLISAYPTDSKVREQEAKRLAKESGQPLPEKKKRPKVVQDHHDDCGEDLSSLGVSDQDPEYIDFVYDPDGDTLDDDVGLPGLVDSLDSFMFFGPCPELHLYLDALNTVVVSDTSEFLAVLHVRSQNKGRYCDIAEICGGEGRTTQLASRRHFTTGPNFDLVTQCDLSNRKDAAEAFSYFENHTVLVVVMAPCCDCFGPLSHLNWDLNYDTMCEKYRNGGAVARFCGRVARLQLEKGYEFLCEQPHPSDLFLEGEWPHVFTYETVEQVRYDRCTCGLRVLEGPHAGCYLKKPSTMTVSCPELGDPFRKRLCPGKHEHLQGLGHPKEHSHAQVWTWKEAELVTDGILAVRRSHSRSAYPARIAGETPWILADGSIDRTAIAHATPGGTPQKEPDSRAPSREAGRHPCRGCRHRRGREHFSHNRIVGQCFYPYDEPDIWPCDACMLDKGRYEDGHIQEVGRCRWPMVPERTAHQRQGHHPRDPARAASSDPTAGLPGTSPAGELGADAEEALDQERIRMEDDALRQLDRDPDLQGGESASSSSSSRNPGRRGPDTVARERSQEDQSRTVSTNVGNTTDWTNFDVARSLRALRLGNDAQQRLILRKLHLRWWHCSANAMSKLLERAGCPPDALAKVKAICDTCAACRAWAKPRNDAIASVDIVDRFNDEVEYDILFIYKFKIFHMVCRCTRWQHAMIVDTKDEDDCMRVIDSWVRLFGPPKILVGDGESGVVRSTATQEYLRRKGIKLKPRAKDQHANIAERRGALTRDVIHRMDAALGAEGLNHIPFEHRLTDAILCGNCLITVNNTTPYNAVLGRSPNLLPNINCPDAEHEEDVRKPGLIRHTNRLREIAVQSMVDGTARARLGRALTTKTLPAGEREGYEVGEEVDHYRPPGCKDASGWIGPSKIVDLTKVTDGIITIRHNQNLKDCKVGDVRRHLAFLCFLAILGHFNGPTWPDVKTVVERLSKGKFLTLGWEFVREWSATSDWALCSESKTHAKEYNLLETFARISLRLHGVKCIQLGLGVRMTHSVKGFAEGITLYWYPGSPQVFTIEEEAEDDRLGEIRWAELDPDQWDRIRHVRFALVGEGVHAIHDPQDSIPSEPSSSSHGDGRLSTIPEEQSQDLSINTDSLFDIDTDHTDADFVCRLEQAGKEASYWCNIEHDATTRCPPEDDPDFDVWDTCGYFGHVIPDLGKDVPYAGLLELGDPGYVELAYADYTWKLLPDVPREPDPSLNEVVVVRMYLSKTAGNQQGKRIVNIERDDDLLTPAEVKEHHEEIQLAMLKELKTWAQYKCFSRRARTGARNVIDCRWVLKWKWETEIGPPTASAPPKRVIRARLTIRGFKDVDKGSVATYAGTSQRYSQRVLVSEAVLRGWPIATSDVSKAFLQGVTYQELAELTGEPIREVNFFLPSYNIPQLQQVPGFEGFDPNSEVLHCDKPGTGSVDAPRCFSLKLSKVTTECDLVPSNVDQELCYLHDKDSGELVAIMAKHVDDLKIAGIKEIVLKILGVIEKVFGPMKVLWHNFTNCGVRHIQDPQTYEASLDQTEYISGMRTIAADTYRGLASESLCAPVLHQMYQSLVGAVAFTALTRLDVLVFIVALQRYSHAPKVIHVRRLNMLVRWMQANPRKLMYRRFKTGKRHLKIIADSSFKKEEEKGHSLRGLLILLCDGDKFDSGGLVHVYDYATKALRFVTRSTFSAELMGACDSFDHGLLIMFILQEILNGVPSKAEARTRREQGGFSVPTVLCTDALSVHAAVTAVNIKAPAEKGLLSHVQYLRELLDNRLLTALCWWDTRDMTADGMTKGSVDRAALTLAMQGTLELKYAPKVWQPHQKAIPRTAE